MVAETYSGFAQSYNMMIGVLICALTTSILFLILPFFDGFIFLADIYLILGCGIGLIFTFKYRKKSQSHIKTGIIVGLVGSVLALLFIGIFDWIVYSLYYGFDFILLLQYILLLFGYYGIMYALVGIILGYISGNYYKKKENIDKKSPLF